MGHWYSEKGEATYTVKAKNGKDRDTTLADARKMKLVPSVTTIIGVLDKPQLTRWSLNEMIHTMVSMPSIDEYHGSHDDFYKEVWRKYKERTSVYSVQGSLVHNKLEKYFKTGELEVEDEEMLLPVIEVVNSLGFKEAQAEVNFADPRGFGGQIDLVLYENGVTKAIIDFKTRQGDTFSEASIYDSYRMQISAYREAETDQPDCYNLLISQTHPGVNFLYKHEEAELERGWNEFESLLEYWKYNNKFDPSFEVQE